MVADDLDRAPERATTAAVKSLARVRRSARVALITVSVVAAVQPVWSQTDDPDVPPPGPASEPSGEPDRFNRFAAKLSPDEPLYFVVGWREGTNAKFQLSFKYRFVNPEGEVTDHVPFFSRVYFGYTQTSLWDLESDSKPFFDTSYRPSLFYRNDRLHDWGDGRGWWWGQIGFEHESNGQGGDASRSLNIIYVQPVLELDRAIGTAHLTVAPRLWAYVGSLDENPDLPDYRGYGELRLAVTGRTEWQVAATVRVGSSAKASVQADFTYPLDRLFLRSFDAFLQVQVFNGWGESLRTYDQRLPWQLRIGIAAIR